jgi:hypothetical protein
VNPDLEPLPEDTGPALAPVTPLHPRADDDLATFRL